MPVCRLSSRVLCAAATAVLCGLCPGAFAVDQGARAQRIVSLDYCADQFVLELAERGHIAALSMDAQEPFSYLRDRAVGLAQVRPLAEEVLSLRPDLVVTSYGGDAALDRLLARANVPVLRVGWIEDLAGVRENLRAMGKGLGNESRAGELLEDFDRRLQALAENRPAARRSALYVTPGGVTGGSGTLVHELLLAAGLDNFSARHGWQPLPLERLAYEQPDLLVTASFLEDEHPWSAARHPLLKRQLSGLPAVTLPGAWTACGGWFLIDAVEAMAAVSGA